LLLFGDQRIAVQDLGPAAEMDGRVRELLTALQNPSSNALPAAQALYQRILAPLLPQLRGTKHLVLSLDGTLSLVPFHALHDGRDYLLGRYKFRHLTSGRVLLRRPPGEPRRSPGPPLVLADPSPGILVAEPGATATHNLYQRLASLPR